MAAVSTIDCPLEASLYELGLYSADVPQLEAFYAAGLGYRFAKADDGVIGTASGRRLRIRPGQSRTLDYAAYALADAAELASLERRLAAAETPFVRLDARGFAPGAICVADPDGNRFLFGMPKENHAPMESVELGRRARLQHVVFASTDPKPFVTFFTDVIGFVLSDRVIDDQGGLRTAFLRCSHEHHSLAVFKADENRLDHHCYEAGDWNLIRDWADHFASCRIPLKWGPGRHGPGNNLFLFVHDPDGNWVEISAELEHVEEGRPIGEWPHEELTLNTWGMGLLRS